MTTTGTSVAQETLTGDYTLDLAHTRIGFSARHAMVTKVRGQFNEFSGSAFLDAETPENSKVEITIKAASIDTRNADRDAHLRSNDFFAMDEYPEITFRSTRVEQTSDSNYDVTGRPHHPWRHQARNGQFRAERWRPRPLGQLPGRLRGPDHHQPQGLGRQLERSPGGRRRHGERKGHPGVRGRGRQGEAGRQQA